MIQIKRVYQTPSSKDGKRFLVDRLWPRGLSKEKAKLAGWIKEAAPTPELRKWFGHDPKKWIEFKKRYRRELPAHLALLRPLLEAARQGTVTLLFAAKDEAHNNAVVLKSYLRSRL
ncbi:MAG TPA: DUF488 domain-containing protein [bacterium]|nr:DUF488 domain-containing protein [bacterium]